MLESPLVSGDVVGVFGKLSADSVGHISEGFYGKAAGLCPHFGIPDLKGIKNGEPPTCIVNMGSHVPNESAKICLRDDRETALVSFYDASLL